MIIGIDTSRANRDHKTGTEWYSYHVIQELKKMTASAVIPSEVEGSLSDLNKSDSSTPLRSGRNDNRDGIKFILYTGEKLKGDLGIMPNANFQEKILNWPPKYLWTQIRLWWELLANPPDVLFVPAHTIPFLPIPKKIKVITVVHDVGFKRFPEIYKPIQVMYHDWTMKKIRSRADVIVTDSEFSKKEIVELYKVKPERIKVIYLGYDKDKYNIEVARVISIPSASLGINSAEEFLKESDSSTALRSGRNDKGVVVKTLAKYKITKPYLLFLGRVEKKKNILNMARAFALAKKTHPDLQLVFAGSPGNGHEELKELINELKISDSVILTGYLSDEEAPMLTANAEIFLFPTLYEGFGIPMLQAMACQTPVLISDMEIHKEVAGDAALPANPYSPEAISDKISRILDNKDLRDGLVQKGLERIREFSWEKTGKEILDIILVSKS